ncbi:MAG: SpoIIE family protein phosphatase [Planctomycetaceae bacterium]|nr:SpoIIE family protein phosphatase [Planctomycetaceae bacterium]
MVGTDAIHRVCGPLLESLLANPVPHNFYRASSLLRETFQANCVLIGDVDTDRRFHAFGVDAQQAALIDHGYWPIYWQEGLKCGTAQFCATPHHVPPANAPVTSGLWIPLYTADHVVGAIVLATDAEPLTQPDLATCHWLGGILGTALQADRSVRAAHQDAQSQLAAFEARSLASQAEVDAMRQHLDVERRQYSHNEFHLRRRYDDLQAVMDGSQAVIYVKSVDGRYEFINRKYEEIFDLRREEVLGRVDTEVFAATPELAERFMENDRMVMRLGSSVQFEEVAPHTDGPHHYVSVKFPLRDERGEIRALAGISTDITLRVRAEQAAQTLRQRNEAILNAVADGVVLLDDAGQIVYLNPVAQTMLGASLDELLGVAFFETSMSLDMTGNPRGAAENPLQQVLELRATISCVEDRFWLPDGRSVPVEYSATPLDLEADVAGAVLTFRDITARLERRQQRRDMKAAQAVQRHLYPRQHPDLPGFDIAGTVLPMQLVCGDYYDFIYRDENRLALIVADACGHDLAAAMLMVNARANLRSCLKTHESIDDVLVAVNEVLAEDLQIGKFVTTFLAELNAQSRTLTYSGAGQNAILLSHDGTNVELKSGALMLGLEQALLVDGAVQVSLQSGDLILICTDGLWEVRSPTGQPLRMAALLQAARSISDLPAEKIVKHLVDISRSHADGQWPQDDVTVVVAKVL